MSLLPAFSGQWSYDDRHNCQEIVSRVWLGPHTAAKLSNLHQEIGVTDIVYVRSSSSGPERDLLRPRSSVHRSFEVDIRDDGVSSCQKIFSLFVDSLSRILLESETNVVLVLGLTGMNRSASLLAAFLIRAHGMDATQASQYLMTRRRCVAISVTLRRQLVEFEISPPKNPVPSIRSAKRSLLDL